MAALAVFLTEILSNDTSASVVTALAWVITRHVVVYMTGGVLTTHWHLPAVHRPNINTALHKHSVHSNNPALSCSAQTKHQHRYWVSLHCVLASCGAVYCNRSCLFAQTLSAQYQTCTILQCTEHIINTFFRLIKFSALHFPKKMRRHSKI